MKRIILTESQYKRLVRRPLNEEVSDEGEKVTDFNIELEGNNIRRWNDNNPEHVERIQKMLKSLNYDLGYYGPNGDGVDGDYGRFTEKAVKEFQENEMPNQPEQWDGVIGPITYEILKDAVKELSDEEGAGDDDLLDNDVETPTIIDLDDGDSVVTNNFECIPTKWEPIFDLINQAESINGGYESLYPGTTVSKKYGNMLGGKNPTELTFKEIVDIIGKGGGGTDNPAVGMWQFTSLLKQAKKAGFNEDDLFSKCNQDKMSMDLMKRKRGVTLDLIKTNPVEAGNRIAMEWAGIPVLSTFSDKRGLHKRGESYYEGSINSSRINPEKVEDAFKKMVGDSDNYEGLKESKICGVKPYTTTSDLNKIKFYQIPNSTNFRSGQPTLPQLAYILETYDIKHIVRMNGNNETSPVGKTKVTWDEERKMAECYGVEFHFINAHKPRYGEKIDGVNLGYTKSMEEIQPYLEKGNTLIHCRNGSDRTGYQVAKYLQNRGMTDQQSLWDYTTNYNGWCEQSTEKFGSGYDTYAQGFINGLDEKIRQELCG